MHASAGGQREVRIKGVPPIDAKNLDWRDRVGKHASSPARVGTRCSQARRTGKEGRLLLNARLPLWADDASTEPVEQAGNKVPVSCWLHLQTLLSLTLTSSRTSESLYEETNRDSLLRRCSHSGITRRPLSTCEAGCDICVM